MVSWIFRCLVTLSAILYPHEGIRIPRDLAEAIDAAAHDQPLPGDDGVEEMARELVVLAGTEGHFSGNAEGPDGFGTALGAWQIHETTLLWLHRRPEDAKDFRSGALIAAELVARSHKVCRRREPLEALGWYASGGPSCDVPEGLAASERRMRLALRLRRAIPVVWVDPYR